MSATIRPLGDAVLVEIATPEKRSAGGVIIPDSHQASTRRGTIRSVGPGAVKDGKLIEPRVKNGDVVVFGRHLGIEVEGLLLLRESDLLGVVS